MSLGFQPTSRPGTARTSEVNHSAYTHNSIPGAPAETHSSYYHKATYKSSHDKHSRPQAVLSTSPSMQQREIYTAPSSYQVHTVTHAPPPPPQFGSSFREIKTTTYTAQPPPAPPPSSIYSRAPAFAPHPPLFTHTPTYTQTSSRSLAAPSGPAAPPQKVIPVDSSTLFPVTRSLYTPPPPTTAPTPALYNSSPMPQQQQQQQYSSSWNPPPQQQQQQFEQQQQQYQQQQSQIPISYSTIPAAPSPFGSRPMTALSSGSGNWGPLRDAKVIDNPDHFLITMEAPGLTARDVHVRLLADRVLKISGEYFEEHTTPLHDGGRRVERNHNTFSKSYSLPLSSDLDNITSYMDGGRVCVRIGKATSRSHTNSVFGHY